MKLASLKAGRDGRLIVVSRDLSRATEASHIAPTLQAALDDWAQAEPKLASLAAALERGAAPSFPFQPQACAAPLPRAYQWADGSSYVNHVELVRKARGADMPDSFLDRSAALSGRLGRIPRSLRSHAAARRGAWSRSRG